MEVFYDYAPEYHTYQRRTRLPCSELVYCLEQEYAGKPVDYLWTGVTGIQWRRLYKELVDGLDA